LSDAPYCERLRELQAQGHEIYLHGFLHKASDRYDASTGQTRAAWLLAQRLVSGGEAEMQDVSEPEGQKRIEQGEQMLQQAGLRLDGFVAPGWSMPHWLLPRLANRGYRFTEDHWHVYDPAAGRKRASVVLNWATRSPARLVSTVLWCRAAKHARAVLPARIAIHPGDMRYRLIRGEIERLLGWASGAFVAHGNELLESPRD
jgi:predicted deacetylase